MELETAIHEEARQTRVVIRGKATLGQLSSLIQLLEIDSGSWQHDRVLLDFSGLASRLQPVERKLLEQVAEARLGKKRVSVVWPGAW